MVLFEFISSKPPMKFFKIQVTAVRCLVLDKDFLDYSLKGLLYYQLIKSHFKR